MSLRQSNSFGQFLNGGELTGIYASPPRSCRSDSAKNVRILDLILAGAVVGGRQDLWLPDFLAHLQRNQHADRLVSSRLVSSRLAWSFYGLHQTQSDLLTSDTLSAFAAKFDLDSGGGDGDTLHQKLNTPGLFSRE
jgi:hypothetical protein